MDVAQLRCFAALANILNFRETARRLGMSQSTVSREIGKLEDELGVELFDRSKHPAALTEEGEALLPYALDMLNTAQSAEHMVELLHKGASGHLYVSALSTCSGILTKALDVFFTRYPDVIVDVAFQTAAEQKTALSEKRYDLHLIQRDMLPSGGAWQWIQTHRDSMALVVPKGHLLAAGTTGKIDYELLARERFIISQEPSNTELYRKILSICAAHGYAPSIMNRYDKLESVLLAVSAGLGVSIMPSAMPSMLFSNAVDVIPIDDMDTSRSYIAAWRKESRNPGLPLFLSVLREIAEQSQQNP